MHECLGKSLSGRKSFFCGDCSEVDSRNNLEGTSGVECHHLIEDEYKFGLKSGFLRKGSILFIPV